MNHTPPYDVVDQAVQKLAVLLGVDVQVADGWFRQSIQRLAEEGRLDVSSVSVKERCVLRKYDHSSSGPPRLIEEIVIEEN